MKDAQPLGVPIWRMSVCRVPYTGFGSDSGILAQNSVFFLLTYGHFGNWANLTNFPVGRSGTHYGHILDDLGPVLTHLDPYGTRSGPVYVLLLLVCICCCCRVYCSRCTAESAFWFLLAFGLEDHPPDQPRRV